MTSLPKNGRLEGPKTTRHHHALTHARTHALLEWADPFSTRAEKDQNDQANRTGGRIREGGPGCLGSSGSLGKKVILPGDDKGDRQSNVTDRRVEPWVPGKRYNDSAPLATLADDGGVVASGLLMSGDKFLPIREKRPTGRTERECGTSITQLQLATMCLPPSTHKQVPVVKLEVLSQARKAIEAATSSPVPTRPSGWLVSQCFM
uniref:Uncharacterized protein n=1 Tax=Anopheles atroparvus TaxID=41427 RepID=A0A182J882_ANOAO